MKIPTSIAPITTFGITIVLSVMLAYQGSTAPLNKEISLPTITHSIAIITPTSGAQIDAILDRYKSDLEKEKGVNWQITIYNAKGDRTLMHAMLNEVLLKKFDLIYSIGTTATKTTIVKTEKRDQFPPLIFSNIFTSAWQEFIDEDPLLPQRITGSIASYDWPRRIQVLQTLFPHAKRVLIPHPALEPDGVHTIQEAKDYLKAVGLTSITLPIDNHSDLLPRLKAHLPHTDVLLLVRESLLFNATDLFVSLADRYHVPVCASDTNSAYKGAAIGYGVDELIAGKIAAQQTIQILCHNKKTSEIPVADLDKKGADIILNHHSITQHRIPLDPRLLFLIKAGSITYHVME